MDKQALKDADWAVKLYNKNVRRHIQLLPPKNDKRANKKFMEEVKANAGKLDNRNRTDRSVPDKQLHDEKDAVKRTAVRKVVKRKKVILGSRHSELSASN